MQDLHIIPDCQGLIEDEQEKIDQAEELQRQQTEIQKQSADAGKQFDKFLNGLSPELQNAIAQESQAMVAQSQPQGMNVPQVI
jgi:hypothetical protein